MDFDGGFNAILAAAYGLSEGETVASHFGAAFDPFMNDQNFVLSVLSLEELGATGNKGLAGITGNPVIANGIAGLATSATAQATVERFLLWQLRNETIEPFGETAQQVSMTSDAFACVAFKLYYCMWCVTLPTSMFGLCALLCTAASCTCLAVCQGVVCTYAPGSGVT